MLQKRNYALPAYTEKGKKSGQHLKDKQYTSIWMH